VSKFISLTNTSIVSKGGAGAPSLGGAVNVNEAVQAQLHKRPRALRRPFLTKKLNYVLLSIYDRFDAK